MVEKRLIEIPGDGIISIQIMDGDCTVGQRCFDLSDMPTVDAVEVVRCKDCIRRYDTDECPMCHLSEGKYYEYTNGNGYCDRGERKENELVEREI